MRIRLSILALLSALLAPTAAWSQASVYMCVQLATGIDRCAPVSATNPLPITGGTPASGGATGSAVPASTDFTGINVAGTLRGWTRANPSGSIFAGQIDVASWAGVTAAAGSGVMTAGTPRIAIATDSPGLIADAPFGTPNTTQVLSVQNLDPCSYAVKSSAAINVATATTTSLVSVSGATVVYVCGLSMTVAPSLTSADTALFEYGTGAACTSPVALTGTYGNGNVALTGVVPVTYGNGGNTIFKSAASNGICILTAGTAVSVQGVLTYVQQ